MPTLPALLSRPLLEPAVEPDPAQQVVQQELSAGLPARIDLDASRGLVLAVPLGVAGAVIAADPAAVVFDTALATPPDPTASRDDGGAWPRLTLVVTGVAGDTVPVVFGVPFRLGGPGSSPGTAVVEVVVDRLMFTAGTLRGPGRFGSRLSLRWRDLTLAPDAGPPLSQPDLSIPRLVTVSTVAKKGIR